MSQEGKRAERTSRSPNRPQVSSSPSQTSLKDRQFTCATLRRLCSLHVRRFLAVPLAGRPPRPAGALVLGGPGPGLLTAAHQHRLHGSWRSPVMQEKQASCTYRKATRCFLLCLIMNREYEIIYM